MDIVKNPIIIGLFAGAITYLYMSWTIDEEHKKREKKHKNKKEKEDVNLFIPLVVAVIFWFIAYAYFEYQPDANNSTITHLPINDTFLPQTVGNNKHPLPLPIAPLASYKFTKDVVDSVSSDPKSFSLLTQGVTVPQNLPDVLIDMV